MKQSSGFPLSPRARAPHPGEEAEWYPIFLLLKRYRGPSWADLYTERDGGLPPRRRAPTPPRVDEGPRAERRLAVLRRQEADPRREPPHDLRGGALPEHLRVLGPRHRDLPDPRRHVHARVPVLLRALGPAVGARRPARAAAAGAGRRADGPQARGRHLRRPRRRGGQGRRPLRGDDPRAQAEAAGGVGRGADAGLPRRRGGGAADGAGRAAGGLQPQHRDRAPPAPAHARRQGVLRRRPLAAAAGEGARRLPGADEVGDHRRAGGDERRGRRDDARPPRTRRRRRHDRPVPAAEPEAHGDRPLGPSRRVPLAPRAGRGTRLRLGLRGPARPLELPRRRAAPRRRNRPRRGRVLPRQPNLADGGGCRQSGWTE